MVEWYVHDMLFRDIGIELELTAKSPFRIGAGKKITLTSPIDLPVLRIPLNGLDVPYIPGSSLKGVFRSTAEFIAKSSGVNDVCMAGDGCRSSYNEYLNQILKSGEFDKVRDILSKYCLICKLYGSGSFASHITFSDAYPKGYVPVGVKTGIAIDRKSGTAKGGALYSVEFVLPNTKFYCRISLKNNPNYAIGLLAYILELINKGFVKIGGFKARGFGTFQIKPINIYGTAYVDGQITNLMELNSLEALDEYDEEVSIQDVKNDYAAFLERFKVAWDGYVRKIRG